MLNKVHEQLIQCRHNNNFNEDRFEEKLEKMHNWGIVLYYNDPKLKDFVILNPQLLTNSFSKICGLTQQKVYLSNNDLRFRFKGEDSRWLLHSTDW